MNRITSGYKQRYRYISAGLFSGGTSILCISTFCLLLIIAITSASALAATAPSVAWDKTYGGTNSEEAKSVVAVSDGYVMVGTLNSYGITRYHDDVYLVKTDLSGNMVWSKTYGQKDVNEIGYSIVAASDGYVIAVYTWDGVYHTGNDADLCIYKVDLNGDMLWQKTYPTSIESGETLSMVAVSDGYLIAGTTYTDSTRKQDVYLVKTDLDGNKVWDKTYGGNNEDYGCSVVAVSDGYAIAGYSYSYTTSSGGSIYADIYLVKTDTNGNLIWQKTYPSPDEQYAYSVAALSDGYVVVGTTFGDGWCMYLVKADLNGNFVWNKTSTSDYEGYSIVGISDGCIIAGTHDIGTDDHLYLAKIYSNGNTAWELTYGVAGIDSVGYSVITSGSGYAVAGNKNWDAYLLKTGADSGTPTTTPQPPHLNSITVTNPASQTPTFSWSYDDPEGSPQAQYQVEVRTGSGGSGTLVWSRSGSGTTNSLTYGGSPLTVGQAYFVMVRVNDGTSWGAWTEKSWVVESSATPTPIATTSAPRESIALGPVSDTSYVYENGVLVKVIGAKSATPTPTPLATISPTPLPVTPTPTPVATAVPTSAPVTATPVSTTDNGTNVGLIIAVIAIIAVAAGAAYYLFGMKK